MNPSRSADAPRPVTWRAVGRTLIGAVIGGSFLAFVRAFNTGDLAFPVRAAFMVSIAIVGSTLGVLTYRLATLIPGMAGRRWPPAVLGGVMLSLPMTVAIWGISWAIPHYGTSIRHLPEFFPTTLAMCVIMTVFGVALRRPGQAAAPAAPMAPAPPKFLERLPVKLAGAEVWAVEAEDHYLRLHTSKGQDLILLRLADAVDELDGIEGAQVHRSWWVARAAIAAARRADGRATLTLKDGSQVPVSRTYAKILRERGWI